MPDELSRSGVLEETQHVFNAALILSRADNLVLVKFGFSALSVPRFFGV